MSKKNLSDAEDTSYVFNPKSSKPSEEIKLYRTMPHGYVLDFRDNEKMPTKHVALTDAEMQLLSEVVIANLDYTQLLAYIERAENEQTS